MKSFFTKNRSMFRQFFPMLVAVAVQQLIGLAVNLLDNFMLGSYSEISMSGAALANQIHYVLMTIVAGTGVGVSVLGSQYWGKGEIDPIRRVLSIGFKFSVLAGAVFCAVTAIIPAQVLGLFTNDAAIIAEGVEYLKVICWTYLIYSASAVLMYSQLSVQTVFIGTVMSCSTIVINGCLNYCLIFGNFGFSELGVRGAAIATLTSRIVELVIIVVYVLFIDKKLKLKLSHLLRFDFSYLPDYLKAAMPVIISGALWGVAQSVQTAILGHVSAAALAANSIASIIFQLFSVFGMSCSSIAAIIMGKTVGSGETHLVRQYSKALQLLFLAFGIVSGALLFICKDAMVGFYNITEETRTLSVAFIAVLSVTTVGSCYEYPVESGIIAGGGDTKYQAIVDNLFMWIWTIPASALSAFVFNFPPIVTFMFLKSDQLLKCIPNAIRCNRYKWVRNLTRQSGEIAAK